MNNRTQNKERQEELEKSFKPTAEAIRDYVDDNVNSNLTMLIDILPDEVIEKLATVYQDRSFRFNKLSSLLSYAKRKVVFDTLSQNNSIEMRRMLAEQLGITVDHLNKMFWRERKRRKIKQQNEKEKKNTKAHRSTERHSIST
jgi:hypothetical protein